MAKSEFISVEAYVDGAVEALSGTSRSLKSISKKTLGIIARGSVKAIKQAIRNSNLERGTGELLKAYRYKIKKDGSEANVFPMALNSGSTIFPKAMTLSYGHSGATKRAKEWDIKPRCFVQAGQKEAEKDWSAEISALVSKELEKYWG